MGRRSTLCVFASAAAVIVAAACAGTARGDAPTIVDNTQFVAPRTAASITATCGFRVLETFTLETRTITFTDESGAITRRITLAKFDGSLVDAATGEPLPWRGVWQQTRDFVAGTITINGLRQEVQRPGEAPVATMVGHVAYPATDFPNLPPIDETPRADFADWWAAVCTAFTP
jgi:hypothetical protein